MLVNSTNGLGVVGDTGIAVGMEKEVGVVVVEAGALAAVGVVGVAGVVGADLASGLMLNLEWSNITK